MDSKLTQQNDVRKGKLKLVVLKATSKYDFKKKKMRLESPEPKRRDRRYILHRSTATYKDFSKFIDDVNSYLHENHVDIVNSEIFQELEQISLKKLEERDNHSKVKPEYRILCLEKA